MAWNETTQEEYSRKSKRHESDLTDGPTRNGR